MACLPPGPEVWSTDWQSAPSLVQMAQPFSSILLSQDSAALERRRSLKTETDYEDVVIGDLLPRIPTNGASICISTSLVIFRLPVIKPKSNWPREFLQQFLKN